MNQLRAIQAAGYEVVGISSPGPHVAVVEAAGIRHIAVPMTRNYTPLADFVSLWRLYWIMRRERFAIVHTHNPKAGLLGQLAARLARVPIIVNTLHGFYLHDRMHPAERRLYIALERVAGWCSTLILSQNAEDVQTAIANRIAPPDKIKYLGNGIDINAFDRRRLPTGARERRREELGIAHGAPVVGFIGRLAARRKGFLDFLAASATVVRHLPSARFLIVGEPDPGKADAVYPEAAHEHGLGEHCIFLGRVRSEDLPAVYAAMDVLVLPSLFEGVPRVVMEASAMGVPSVVTDVKGNREAIVNGKTGVMVPLGDRQCLAEAILHVLEKKDDARHMGEEARRLAEQRFDERAIFATVLSAYSTLLSERGIAPPEAGPSRALEP